MALVLVHERVDELRRHRLSTDRRNLGALLGTVGGYIALIGWLRGNSLNGGISSLGNVPAADLLIILFGMPAFAALVAWLFAGREPASMTHQPIE